MISAEDRIKQNCLRFQICGSAWYKFNAQILKEQIEKSLPNSFKTAVYADPGVTGRFDVTHFKSMADLKLKKDGKIIWKKDPNREYNSYQYEILVKIISDLDNLLEPGGKFAKIYAKKAAEEAKKAAKEGVKAAGDAVKTAATAVKDKAGDAMKSVR